MLCSPRYVFFMLRPAFSMLRGCRLFVVMLLFFLTSQASAQQNPKDSVEFLDGRVVTGEILEIRKDEREFDFVADGGGSMKTYAYADVHAVRFRGRSFVLTPKKVSGSSPTVGRGQRGRSKADVLKLIEEAGRVPPDWFESTEMNHPSTLDLDWPLKAEGPWDESKNVGQYIWGRVNPNEGRWRSGIKLVHQCVARHQREPELLQRDMEKLGMMYFELLQDYPRAAFWLRKSKATASKMSGIELAECYWQLGSPELAMDVLKSRTLHVGAIKLFAEMGDMDRAIALARLYVQNNTMVSEACLAIGDALRNAGQFDLAIEQYEKVIATPARNEEYANRFRARAEGAIESIRLFEKLDLNHIADGTYVDRSVGYNGPVEVRVRVEGARMTDVVVVKHDEKQFYAALTDTTSKIIDKQSVRGIDGTTGATITSQAILHATARALAQGAKP